MAPEPTPRAPSNFGRQDSVTSPEKGACRSFGPRVRGLFALACLMLSGATAAETFARPFVFAPNAGTPPVEGAQVRGALELAATGGDAVHGLSGLVWCQGVLHAVSDQGELLDIAPEMHEGTLTGARLLARRPLLDDAGAPLRGRARDAEGLALAGCAPRPEFFVSFEQHQRVVRFDAAGQPLASIPTPAHFARRLNEVPANSGLEALALHPRLGLVAGLEYPAQGLAGQILGFAPQPAVWRYPPIAHKGALVGLETLPDGRLLALERRFLSPWKPLIISIQILDLPPPDASPAPATPSAQLLARFSSTEGWPVDNFEALALDAHGGLFMLSDDNANPRQKTLLVYLKLKLPPRTDAP